MYKQTVTYTDFNGDEQTEDLYFHLSKSELLDMELSKPGGYSAYLQAIVDAGDNLKIFRTFKEIFIMAYGIRSEDGRSFKKNDEIRQEFESSPALDELVFTVMQDPKQAEDFITNVMPKGIAEEAKKKGTRNARK